MGSVKNAESQERGNMPNLSLDRMHAGQTGKVLRVHGGRGFRKRLEVLGIRPGMKITKVSGQIMRGPVIVRIGVTQVAIGFGMARRILVET
jgi:ferrous iron transport protein A